MPIALSRELPPTYRGFSTSFSEPDPADNSVRMLRPVEPGFIDYWFKHDTKIEIMAIIKENQKIVDNGIKTTPTAISIFTQYEHLAQIKQVIDASKELSASSGGDYIVKPDIMTDRYPVADIKE